MSDLASLAHARLLEATSSGMLLEALDTVGAEAWVSIEFVFDDAIRFRLSRQRPATRQEGGPTDRFAGPATVSQDGGGLHLSSDVLTADVQLDPFHWAVRTRSGARIWAQQDNDINVRGTRLAPRMSLSPAGSSYPMAVDSFAIEPGEGFFGYGEKFFSHDKRGHDVTNWNLDAHGVETERAYKNIPFFLSSRGYGVLVNTTTRVTHHVGDPERTAASYILEVDEDALDYTLFWGPSFKHILKRYAQLTGFAPLPPKWAFGLWMSRCYYHDREAVEAVAGELRQRGIPSDVLVFDAYWMRDAHLCDLEWDEDRFPDPTGMIAGLRAQGFRTCLWEAPLVPTGSEMFEEGRRARYFLENEEGGVYLVETGLVLATHGASGYMGQGEAGDFDDLPAAPPGAMIDFTNPEAVRWYQQKHRLLLAQGVEVFKTDFGEQVPPDARSPSSGLTGRQIHNAYALAYNEAVADVCREANGHGLVWARSAWTGSQRVPVHWGGDPQATYSSMAATLRGGLSVGLSGIPYWGHDIGGFFGPRPSARLYVRWAQFGLLSTLARCHGTTVREPWHYGEEAERIFRTYARLRYQLLPYLYAQAAVAAETGLPVMRPLVIEFQDDPTARGVDSQYLLGDAIMCAPVLDDRDQRIVYLPAGRWLDYWSGEMRSGPDHITYHAPLDVLPLFIRAGGIVAFGEELASVGSEAQRIERILVVPDDRQTTLYLREPDARISCRLEDDVVDLEIFGLSGPVQLELFGLRMPQTVECDGSRLEQIDRPSRDVGGWAYDRGQLRVTCAASPGGTRLSCRSGLAPSHGASDEPGVVAR